MPKVSFKLVEQFSDLRSNEIAYNFAIENQGSIAIDLYSIIPRIPEGVDIVEVKDPSLMAVREKHSALCSELSVLLNNHLLVSSEEFQRQINQIQKKQVDELISEVTGWFGILRFYLNLFKGTFLNRMESMRKSSNAYSFEVKKKSDADLAFNRWFNNSDNSIKVSKDLFEAKIAQLAVLESEMGTDLKSSSLASIEPDSFFAMTYVLKFPRSSINPKKYNIAIEGSYSEYEKDERHVGGATTSLIISPKPYILTLLAIISGLLGVALKVAIAATANNVGFWDQIKQPTVVNSAISAIILSTLFFNVYEFTDMSKKFQIGIGWRSALLIGVLCGLLEKRILDAIVAFIGLS